MNIVQKFLANLFTEKKFKALTQEQNEALIDCLTLAVVVDTEIEEREMKEVNDAVGMFDWNGSISLDAYVDDALDRAQQVFVEEGALRMFATDIAERLDEEWLCEEAYYISARIVTADGDLNEDERTLLNAMVESMGITRQRLQNITQKLMEETTF